MSVSICKVLFGFWWNLNTKEKQIRLIATAATTVVASIIYKEVNKR